jgi:transcription elongation factor
LVKRVLYTFLATALTLFSSKLFAQVPAISYSPTPVSLLVGTAVGTAPNPTITLTNTGGAVPAFAYGTVSTFVLNSSNINNPKGITSDGAGNLYEADNGGNAIYMINSAGTATLIAGNTAGEVDNPTGTSAKFNGPTGIVYDKKSKHYLTLCSNHNCRIKRLCSRNN